MAKNPFAKKSAQQQVTLLPAPKVKQSKLLELDEQLHEFKSSLNGINSKAIDEQLFNPLDVINEFMKIFYEQVGDNEGEEALEVLNSLTEKLTDLKASVVSMQVQHAIAYILSKEYDFYYDNFIEEYWCRNLDVEDWSFNVYALVPSWASKYYFKKPNSPFTSEAELLGEVYHILGSFFWNHMQALLSCADKKSIAFFAEVDSKTYFIDDGKNHLINGDGERIYLNSIVEYFLNNPENFTLISRVSHSDWESEPVWISVEAARALLKHYPFMTIAYKNALYGMIRQLRCLLLNDFGDFENEAHASNEILDLLEEMAILKDYQSFEFDLTEKDWKNLVSMVLNKLSGTTLNRVCEILINSFSISAEKIQDFVVQYVNNLLKNINSVETMYRIADLLSDPLAFEVIAVENYTLIKSFNPNS